MNKIKPRQIKITKTLNIKNRIKVVREKQINI